MRNTLPKLSPELFRRVDLLSGCQGHWLLIRDGEPETDCSHQWHQSPDEPLQACLEDKWRNLSLGFAPSYCGYSDYSSTGLVGLANFNCLTDPASTPDQFGGILEVGYGWNGRGVVLDLRFAPFDVLETIAALESYPLISDNEHSQLECDGIAKLWGEDSVADRVSTLQDLDLCIFAARRDSAPWELDRLRESLVEELNSYPTLAA
jgi:hypothetical protein